jgi:DNA polymerase-3 subunit delta'
MLKDVREQDEGVRFLRRVVEQRLTSPLLLVGDEGVGRRYSVLQATKEMFCTGSRENNCDCLDCVQVNQNMHPDLVTLVPEGDKDIGVDAIRSLIAMADVCPTTTTHRVVVIDGADRLTTAAANALLKTLEEPPLTTRFFLLAESAERVIPTIRSRCGLVSYHALSEAMVLSVLQQFEPDGAKALVFARLGEGSVGRAVRYWGSGRLVLRDKTFSLIRLALERDLAGLFSAIDSVEKELPQVLLFLSHLLHDMLMVQTDHTRLVNVDMSEEIAATSARVSASVWHAFMGNLHALRVQARATKLFLSFHVKTLFTQALSV